MPPLSNEDLAITELLRNEETSQEAFRLLVQTYQERLYWHIRRMVTDHEDANDVLQEVFVRVWKFHDQYKGDSQLYTWLYRIATNETLSFLNKRKKRKFLSIDNGEIKLENTLKADRYFDGDQAQLKLKLAIDTLPEKQQLVFNLRYYDEMKYEEMSEVLNTSVGALKASYHHAVRKIEKFLTGD